MMDRGTELDWVKGITEPSEKSGREHVNRANSRNIKGEGGGLETARDAKVPPVGSKEKVMEWGWQARTVLTRHQWFEGSCWKDKEVIRVPGRLLATAAGGKGNTSSCLERATKKLF